MSAKESDYNIHDVDKEMSSNNSCRCRSCPSLSDRTNGKRQQLRQRRIG